MLWSQTDLDLIPSSTTYVLCETDKRLNLSGLQFSDKSTQSNGLKLTHSGKLFKIGFVLETTSGMLIVFYYRSKRAHTRCRPRKSGHITWPDHPDLSKLSKALSEIRSHLVLERMGIITAVSMAQMSGKSHFHSLRKDFPAGPVFTCFCALGKKSCFY